LLFACLCCGVVAAQEPPPIDISAVENPTDKVVPGAPAGAPPVTTISYTFRNAAKKDIAACVVVTEFYDGETKVMQQMTRLISGHPNASTLVPGSAWYPGVIARAVHQATGRPLDYKPVLDYVVFTDGSTWGPDAMKNAGYIEGYLQGVRIGAKPPSR
jgi:hypothetical protein